MISEDSSGEVPRVSLTTAQRRKLVELLARAIVAELRTEHGVDAPTPSTGPEHEKEKVQRTAAR